jgi:hypothetical protein
MKPRQGKHRKIVSGHTTQLPWDKAQYGGLFIAFVLWICCASAWPDVYQIDSVRINAPNIQNDSLIYTLDVRFRDHPGPFWSYYDQGSGMIVIEFLDAQIIAPLVRFPKGMPFLGFKVRKAESEMSLTRAVSRVTIYVDRGPNGEQFWNNDVKLANNSTVRVVIWKEKTATDKGRVRKTRAVAISVGASVLVLFVIIAIIAL